MCQAISEGGIRCPQHRYRSLAAISSVSIETGLTRFQVTQLFNTLRKEGIHAEPVSEEIIKARTEEYTQASRNSQSVLSNFEQSVAENFDDPASDYAFSTLRKRAQEQSEALEKELRSYSRRFGLTYKEVKELYGKALKEEYRYGEPDVNHFALAESVSKNLPSDKTSINALQVCFRRASPINSYEHIDRSEVLTEHVISIKRESMGVLYSEEDQHLQIKNLNEDTVLIRKDVPEEIFRDLISEDSKKSLAAYLTVKNDLDTYGYRTDAEERRHSLLYRCISCGQFASLSHHDCPKLSRREELLEQFQWDIEKVNEVLWEEYIASQNEQKKVSRVTELVFQYPVTNEPIPRVAESRTDRTSNEEHFIYDDPDFISSESLPINAAGHSNDSISSLALNPTNSEIVWQGIRSGFDDHKIVSLTKKPDPSAFKNKALQERIHNFWDTATQAGHNPGAIVTVKREHITSVQALYIRGELEATLSTDSEAVSIAKVDHEFNRKYIRDTSNMNRYTRCDSKWDDVDIETLESSPWSIKRYLQSQNGISIESPSFVDIAHSLESGKTVEAVVSVHIPQGAYVENATYYESDEFRKLRGSVLIQSIDNKAQVVESSLKCECSDYRRAYYCQHAALAESQLNNLYKIAAEVTSPEEDDRQAKQIRELYNYSTSTNTPFILNHNDEGEMQVQFTAPYSSRNPHGTQASAKKLLEETLTELRGYQDGEELTPQLRERLFSNETGMPAVPFNNQTRVSNINFSHSAEDISEAISDNFEIETSIQTTYKDKYFAEKQEYVTGTVTFNKGSSYLNHSIKEHKLKCTCLEYQEKYDCKHIKDTLEERVNQVFPIPHDYIYPGIAELRVLLSEEIERFPDQERLYKAERYALTYEDASSDEELTALAKESIAEEDRIAEEKRIEKERRQESYKKHQDERLSAWENNESIQLSENMDAFQEALNKAQAKAKRGSSADVLKMQYENVTDGICAPGEGNRSFGIEIEFEIDDDDYESYKEKLGTIARELHEAGLTSCGYQQHYHASSGSWNEWSFEEDCTVSGEIVSPLLQDTPEHWRQLEQVIEIVKRNGGKATSNAGSHVHISTGSYSRSKAKHSQLLQSVKENQDTLFRLASDPSRGVHRGIRWCNPNVTPDTEEISLENDEEAYSGYGNSHHTSMVNFEASLDQHQEEHKAHVEFRMWDASLNAAAIQQQVVLSAALVDYAERRINKEGKYVPSDKEIRHVGYEVEKGNRGKTAGMSRSKFNESYRPAAELFDNLFRTDAQKDQAVALLAVTSPQSEDPEDLKKNWLQRLFRR